MTSAFAGLLFPFILPPGRLHKALTETDQYTGHLSPVKWALRPASFAVDLVSVCRRCSCSRCVLQKVRVLEELLKRPRPWDQTYLVRPDRKLPCCESLEDS